SMSSGSGGSGQSGLSGTGTSGLNGGQSTNTQAQDFVGSNGAQNFVGGGMQGNSNGSNRQFQAFQQNQGMTNQGMSTTGSPRQIKTALRVNFAGPSAGDLQSAGRTAPANQASLQRFSARNPQFAGLNVALSANGVATLQGSVPTADAARLAANLLRLQPGVRSVDNQATVEPAAQ
ncbi:MAG: BON domain-containing protein, partial [Planctomycetaceae bacterium]